MVACIAERESLCFCLRIPTCALPFLLWLSPTLWNVVMLIRHAGFLFGFVDMGKSQYVAKVSRARRLFHQPVKFSPKEAYDYYAESPSYRDRSMEFQRKRVEVGVQAAPVYTESTQQTDWNLRKPVSIQVLSPCLFSLSTLKFSPLLGKECVDVALGYPHAWRWLLGMFPHPISQVEAITFEEDIIAEIVQSKEMRRFLCKTVPMLCRFSMHSACA